MSSSTILFEPVPVARIGVRNDDIELPYDQREIVVASDFSTFAFMIEEYIASGVTRIAIRKSSPDVALLSDMPLLLKKRVIVVDDDREREIAIRLLYGVFNELGVGVNDAGRLKFPKDISPRTAGQISRFVDECQRLTLGFSHSLRISTDATVAASIARSLRDHLKGSEIRLILAQLEAVFSSYKGIEFNGPTPVLSKPQELVSVFDRLVNDKQYLSFSESVDQLLLSDKREAALSRIREWGRDVTDNSLFSVLWNYGGKIVKVFTGTPIPEKDAISAIVSGRKLPLIIELDGARERAVEQWKKYASSAAPYTANNSDVSVLWLPPLKSAKAEKVGSLKQNLGTVAELKTALEDFYKKLKGIQKVDNSA